MKIQTQRTGTQPKNHQNTGLLTKPVASFTYRGIQCEVHEHRLSASMQFTNGYMSGPFKALSYDDADNLADAHGGFTYFHPGTDGCVTLGFDTGHSFDGPHTQNVAYVTQAIRDAIDSLYDADAIDTEAL